MHIASLMLRHKGTRHYRYADGLSQITHRIGPLGQTLAYRYDCQRLGFNEP